MGHFRIPAGSSGRQGPNEIRNDSISQLGVGPATSSSIPSPGSVRVAYPDYLLANSGDQLLEVSFQIVTLLKDVSALIPHAGPLSQVLGVTRELLVIVSDMRDIKESCEYLVERILRFMKWLAEEMAVLNIPLQFGSPTAARLFALVENLKLIQSDVDQWREFGKVKRLVNRTKIKRALLKHGQNITDCILAFNTRTLLQLGTSTDKAALERAHPVNVTSMPIVPDSVPSESAALQSFMTQPAGQAMFEQIGRAVHSRAETLGEDGEPTFGIPPDQDADTNSEHENLDDDSDTKLETISFFTAEEYESMLASTQRVASMNHASSLVDEDSQYLMKKIANLTLEAGRPLSDNPAPDVHRDSPTVYEHSLHIPQTGKPLTQLRQTISDTLDLLNILQQSKQVHPDALAHAMQKLEYNLADLGMHEEAAGVQTICVVIYRHLASDSPTTFEPYLARSLNILSVGLHELGRRQEGLEAVRESVDIRRRLAEQNTTSYADLTASLINLGNRLADLGHLEEAVKALEEAVDIQRRLHVDPDSAVDPQLAMSLHNLSDTLTTLCRPEEALKAIQDAVDIHQRLASDNPATFNPNFGMSLNNLSMCLGILGRQEESLKAIQDAVGIIRQLAEDRPASFNPWLAKVLNTLSNRLSIMDQPERALQAIQEAVKINRQLAADRPASFDPALSRSLNDLSICLYNLERREEALTTIQEAIGIRRQLASAEPSAFTQDLAVSLWSLACWLYPNHLGDAVKAIEESVGLYRTLSVDHPVMYMEDLVNSLKTMSTCLHSLGRIEDAEHILREATELEKDIPH